MHGEFIPLSTLLHSLEKPNRLYYLYRKAADTGARGAMLRFKWFCNRYEPEEITRLETMFLTSGETLSTRSKPSTPTPAPAKVPHRLSPGSNRK